MKISMCKHVYPKTWKQYLFPSALLLLLDGYFGI